MSLIQLQSIRKIYGGRTIFQHLDWTIEDHARIGLVGPNGAGKSTLLKIIAGLESADEGQMARQRELVTSYLPQHIEPDPRTPLGVVVQTRPEIEKIEAELATIEQGMSQDDVTRDMSKMERLLAQQERALHKLETMNISGIEGEARARLRELGFTNDDLKKSIGELSGGRRKMVFLVACILRKPDLLLLDEPETHLDLSARSRIEAAIKSFDGAIVIVSHDRYLLDETVYEIAQLEAGALTLWQGNYSTYAAERELALRRQEILYATQQKEIDRLEDAIRRFKQWASEMPDSADNSRHIKQARNKQRQIDGMEKIDRPVMERRKMGLQLREMHRSGQKVAELKGIDISIGGHHIVQDAQLEIRRGDRVGIIGANGAGKTLLARVVAEDLAPCAGSIWKGPSVETGYFAQSQETLPQDASAIDLVRQVKPMREDEGVAQLMKFLFTYDQVRQTVSKMSGGERSRLQLLLLMLGQANFLVLDEPTNHLDIDSMEVLEQSLEDYAGTVLVISHDRYFLDRMVDRIVEVNAGRLRESAGGYSEWHDRIGAG